MSIQPEVPKGESAADKKMEIVCLAGNRTGQQAMNLFSCRYPHDWNADIGAVAPRQSYYEATMAKVHENAKFWLAELADGEAAVYGPDPYYNDNHDDQFQIRKLAVCGDSRNHLGEDVGDNPCRASVIRAMGTAGSTVNLQECAVLWNSLNQLLWSCQVKRPRCCYRKCCEIKMLKTRRKVSTQPKFCVYSLLHRHHQHRKIVQAGRCGNQLKLLSDLMCVHASGFERIGSF